MMNREMRACIMKALQRALSLSQITKSTRCPARGFCYRSGSNQLLNQEGLLAQQDDLQSLKVQLFDDAERNWKISIGINILTQLLLLATVFLNWSFLLAISGSLAFASPAVVFYFREKAGGLSKKAEKVRRLIQYADGLGVAVSPSEMARVMAWKLGAEPVELRHTEPYYASAEGSGTQRLVENMEESAYFTYNLAGKVKDLFFVIILAMLGVVVGILYYFSTNQAPSAAILMLSKSATIIVSAIFLADLLIIYFRYAEMETGAREAYVRFSHLCEKAGTSLHEVMQQVEDYDVAATQAPPIPKFFYTRYMAKLNESYKTSHG
jgi:hypothetical protein